MYKFCIHEDVEADLDVLWTECPEAAATIVAFLEEVESNQDLLDRLTQHDFGPPNISDFHVSKWIEQWNKRRNVWRLKIWELEERGLKYRIIYAFIPKTHTYYVLGIVPRNFDYNEKHPVSQRVIKAYEKL